MVREYLAGLVNQGDRREARERLKAAMEKGIIDLGDWKWNRDELYER